MSNSLTIEQIRKLDTESIGTARSAALHFQKGNISEAEELLKKLPVIEGMPSLKEFHQAFVKHRENFAKWDDPGVFTGGEGPFAVAFGSYARALVYASFDVKVAKSADNQERWAYHWGIDALRAGGFEKQAQHMESFVVDELKQTPDKYVQITGKAEELTDKTKKIITAGGS